MVRKQYKGQPKKSKRDCQLYATELIIQSYIPSRFNLIFFYWIVRVGLIVKVFIVPVMVWVQVTLVALLLGLYPHLIIHQKNLNFFYYVTLISCYNFHSYKHQSNRSLNPSKLNKINQILILWFGGNSK